MTCDLNHRNQRSHQVDQANVVEFHTRHCHVGDIEYVATCDVSHRNQAGFSLSIAASMELYYHTPCTCSKIPPSPPATTSNYATRTLLWLLLAPKKSGTKSWDAIHQHLASRFINIIFENDKKIWLVVSTHLKSISQIGSSSPNRGEHKKYLSCHHPENWIPVHEDHRLDSKYFFVATPIFGSSPSS